jgi:hypothetical protein
MMLDVLFNIASQVSLHIHILIENSIMLWVTDFGLDPSQSDSEQKCSVPQNRISFASPIIHNMYHATVNGTKKIDISWNSKNSEVELNGNKYKADVLSGADNSSHWIHNHRSYSAEIVQINFESKEVLVKVNGNPYHIQLKDRFDDLLQSLGMESTGKTSKRQCPV